jgi:hypothetical protein
MLVLLDSNKSGEGIMKSRQAPREGSADHPAARREESRMRISLLWNALSLAASFADRWSNTYLKTQDLTANGV